MVSVAGKTLGDFPDILRTLHNEDPEIAKNTPAGSLKEYEWICDFCQGIYTGPVIRKTRRGDKCPKMECMLKKKYGNDYIQKPKRGTRIPIIRTIQAPNENEIEEWTKPHPDLLMQDYMVSNLGRIKNKNSSIKKTDNPRIVYNRGQYYCSDNKSRGYTDHYIVAKTFIANDDPEHKITVNHINGNCKDNRVINLEWATYAEQNYKENRGTIVFNRQSVQQLDLKTGEVIHTWASVSLAGSHIGKSPSLIGKVCNSKAKSAGGFGWRRQPHEDLLGEVWVTLQSINSQEIEAIQVSNKGRIKNSKDIATYGILSPEGYYRTDVQYKSNPLKKTRHGVHRIIAEAFDLSRREDQIFVNRNISSLIIILCNFIKII